MTRFLRTSAGLINADRIERIEKGERVGARRQSCAILSDGGVATLPDEVNTIEQTLLPVVAAAPGYIRLRYYADGGADGASWVDRMPVVAWRIDENSALPVTLEDDGDTVRWGVLLPDGQVIEPFSQTFPDEEAWRAEMDRQAKAERKPKAAE